jgi:predicted O-linked N-acetylglucosamine transferase (SPINDLY family)
MNAMSSVRRVGHVVGSVDRYVTLLVESLQERGVESTVFATGSIAGDAVQSSDRIAQDIRDTGVQIVFFHAGASDEIAALVASLRAAPVQVNVNREVEMDAADLFDGFVHLTQNAMARSRLGSRLSVWIPPSSDIEKELQSATFETRESLGLESASSVSATLSTPPRDRSIGFIRTVIEFLKRYPDHFHFLGGISDVRAIRGLLHSEGVLPRVRFLGPNSSARPLLGAVDLYLVAFPDPHSNGVLEMMAAGKPVIALRQAADSEFNTAAELVGEKELTPSTPGEYLALADRLIRDTAARSRLGDAMQKRFFMEFTPSRLADRYLEFANRLVK